MVMFFCPRKYAVIALALAGLLALGGCGKVENALQAPAAPSPAASPAEKSATPNSFDDVTAQLDPGGDFYLYLNTAQWLGRLSHGIDTIHDLVLSGTGSQSVPNPVQAEKAFFLIKDIAEKSGLEEITGIGASSFAIAPGLYRNKVFVHHDADKASGILWSLYGKAPHPLAGLDLLPADTALASYGDFDLAQLINFLRQEANQPRFPVAQLAVARWQTQFAGITGLQLDDVLGSLNGAMGMVLTLDATSTITVPIAGQPQTIPTPRLAILLAVKSDLIFKQVDKMLSILPGLIKVDEPDLRMRTMPLPKFPALKPRLTVAQWNGFLVIASDDKLIRDMIAVQKGAPGYTSTPEYATLSAGLPQQGNRFGLVTQRFADTYGTLRSQMFANQPAFAPAQAVLLRRLLSRYQHTYQTFGVGVCLPNGQLAVSQGPGGSSQLLAPLVIAPAAIAAAIPAFNGGSEKALETKSLSNAKQICLACKQYAIDHAGDYPPSLDALFPTYLTDRSVLVSPFMPGVPEGYLYCYTPGLKQTDAPDTVILEDKFALLKKLRIEVHLDDSSSVTHAP